MTTSRLFFLRKSFELKKNTHKQKSTNKIKQQNKIKQTLNNKDNIFYAPKNLKLLCFAFWCFFLRSKSVRKKKNKINRLEIVLIDLILLYYLWDHSEI